MSLPDITLTEIEAVVEVLQSGRLSMGANTQDFEKTFATYLGTQYGVSVSSGTAGLHLTMIAAGIKEGDEVITSPFSFVASSNCILYERGTPVFVDIDPLTGNIDPRHIEAAITPRTKAILVVHVFGQPADMDAIMDIAQRHHLLVIEDTCEAIGAQYKGRTAGTFGDAAVFGFYPNKQITTGEGGIITTNREDWCQLFRSLRNQGRDVFDAWLNHSRLGYNYRLDEMSATLGLVQMRRIEELLQKRERVAAWYTERLLGIERIHSPFIKDTTTRMSWFVYVVRLESNRDQLVEKLASANIPSRPYFTPIHLQPFYQERFGWQRGDFPVCELAGDTSLALPFSGLMTEAEVDYVCQHLGKLLG
jgi:perosamine synthetase